MYTLEELKEKIKEDYKGFKLFSSNLDNGYVSSFTISRPVETEVLVFTYFWDSKFDSYIAYFV